MPDTPVRVRFAPSPTGKLHVGGARTAIYNWAFARANHGTFILRIDDTDPTRSTEENTQVILRAMRWLGLDWDEGPHYQSRRGDLYQEALDRLDDLGLTYPCFCTRSELHAASAPHASDGTVLYAGTCRGLSPDEVSARSAVRPPATRLRVPGADDPAGTIDFVDLGYGPHHEVLARECGDFLVRRSDGVVAYQLAVVVDDLEMGVTQVVRGHDLLGSSARQTYLARLLGGRPPQFGHVPLLVAPDGRRLSKRDRDLGVASLRERGVGADVVVGALAHLVGLAGEGERVMPCDLVGRFSWDLVAAHRADVVADDATLRL